MIVPSKRTRKQSAIGRPAAIAIVALLLGSAPVIVFGAEPAIEAPAAPSGPQTLSGDWFGYGPALREAGFDFRLEWAQFYQGMTRGDGDKTWRYGSHFDALARFDVSKYWFWDGLSLTAQGQVNPGHNINGFGGTLLPLNTALKFPGIEGADRSDLMALFLTQRFGDRVSLSLGKINALEFARAAPLQGGGGVDTFWGNVAAPISGLTPATFHGAQLGISTKAINYSLMVYDPRDATNRPLFSDLFENGVTVNGSATLKTSISDLSGYYTIRAAYSTREGADFSELIQPPGARPGTKSGSWFVAASFQQYLVQDPNQPTRGWGLFGQIAKSDGNPNIVDWMAYFGVGGSSLIPGRPDDRFGIGYLRLGGSGALKRELAPFLELEDEWTVEAFYNVAVTPWLRVSAHIQFAKPAIGSFRNAVYAGFGTYIRF